MFVSAIDYVRSVKITGKVKQYHSNFMNTIDEMTMLGLLACVLASPCNNVYMYLPLFCIQ